MLDLRGRGGMGFAVLGMGREVLVAFKGVRGFEVLGGAPKGVGEENILM